MQYFQSVVRDIFNSWFLVWLSSNLVCRPNWKDDASSVSHWCTWHCPHQGFILLSTNPYNPDREKCSHDKFSQDSTAVIFGEDVAFGGVFRCTVNCFTHFPLIFSKHQLYLISIEHLWPHSICRSANLICIIPIRLVLRKNLAKTESSTPPFANRCSCWWILCYVLQTSQFFSHAGNCWFCHWPVGCWCQRNRRDPICGLHIPCIWSGFKMSDIFSPLVLYPNNPLHDNTWIKVSILPRL